MESFATSDFFDNYTFNYKFDDRVTYDVKHTKYGIFNTNFYINNFKTYLLPKIEKSDENTYQREMNLFHLYPIFEENILSGSIITRCIKVLILIKSEYLNQNRYLLTRMIRPTPFNVKPSSEYLDWRFNLYKKQESSPNDSFNIVHVMNMLMEFKFPDESKFDKTNATDDPNLDSYYYARKTADLIIFKVPADLKTFRWLLRHGYPIYCAIVLFESAKSKENYMFGSYRYPDTNTEKLIGAHPILITGYNHDKRTFNVLNLMSVDWGYSCKGVISYDYILNPELCADIWTMTYSGYYD